MKMGGRPPLTSAAAMQQLEQPAQPEQVDQRQIMPSQSTDSKRKRLTQACDTCRKKKIRCDGGKPTCGNCTKWNRECSYLPSNKKRGPRQGYIEMLEKRLDKMEKMLCPSNNANETKSSPSPQPTQKPNPDTTLINNINIQTSTLRRTSNESSADLIKGASESSMFSPKSFSSHTSYSPDKNNDDVLPSLEVIQHLVALYFIHVYPSTPIFDRDTLLREIRERRCPEFLLLSILAVSARYSTHRDVKLFPPWLAGDSFASKARELLVKAIDDPCLTNVQGLMLLSLHEFGCARGPRSWMYSGMAIRMALELGLNKEPDREENLSDCQPAERWVQQEVRRRVFWTVFVMDKLTSASTGRPPSLHEEDCDVLLPSDEDDWRKGQCYSESMDGQQIAHFNAQSLQASNLLSISTSAVPLTETRRRPPLSCFAYMLRAVTLLGRVTTYVNRGIKSKDGLAPYDPNSEFSRLDQQIDSWYNQLPLHLKNTPANLERYRTQRTQDSSRFVMAHVLHNTLIVLLHRPSLVLVDTLNSDVVQTELRDFVNASVEKCLAAVDNVTVMIKDINHTLELVPPFLSYMTYTVATIVVNNVFSSAPDEALKAKKALNEHFRLLYTMRDYWAMADKLYFMIRDLYAMHCNALRQQQEDEGTDKVAASFNPMSDWPLPFDLWPSPADTNSSLPNQQASQSMPNPLPNGLARKMSLADLSLSTCDGASCTNWVLGDNSDNITAAIQSMGRSPGASNQVFDIGAPSGSELPWTFPTSSYSTGINGGTTSQNQTQPPF